jgi:CcmD family protein
VILASSISATQVHFVAAVYGVAWIVVLAYVVILNSKLGRLERQLDEIVGLLERPGGDA